MSNIVKDKNIKNHTYYIFDDIINIKDLGPNNIKIDEKSYTNILIYYIAYVMIKDSKYVKINSVNILYLMVNKMNGYFEETNENKYLTLVPINESKEKTEYELWIKIRDLIRLITKTSDDYDEKDIKIKLSSDDKLPLNKTIEIPVMVIVVRTVFCENTKYPQFLLDECLYEI